MKLGLSFPQTEIGTDPSKIKDFMQWVVMKFYFRRQKK